MMNAPPPPPPQFPQHIPVAGGIGNNDISVDQNNEALQLRQHELARALDIKAAVERDDRLRNLSDFEYAQWALTTEALPLEMILERVYAIQCFKEQYRLQDTVQECADLLVNYCIARHPRTILSFDYLANQKHFIVVMDTAAFNPQTIQTEEDFRIYQGTNFYLYQAGARDFDCIRTGLSIMNECMGATMMLHNQEVLDRLTHELFLPYPKNDDAPYYFLNAPTVVVFIFGILKRFLSPQTQKAYKIGWEIPGFEGRRLDSLYLTPNAEVATARTMTRICEALEQRYKNQAGFSLAKVRIRT